MRKLFSTFAVTTLLAVSLFGQAGKAKAGGTTTTPPPPPPAASATKSGTAKSAKSTKELPAAERCIAKTQDGDRCKRKATAGKYCWQHDPNRKAKAKKS